MKVVYFTPRVHYKAYDTFSFFSVCLFTTMFSTVSWSMKLVKAEKFVEVLVRYRVESGADCVVKKYSWWLEPGGE